MLEVQIEYILDIALDDPEVENEVRHRAIAVSCSSFRLKDRLINGRHAADGPAKHLEHAIEPMFRSITLDHGGDRDRSRVDHRIVWTVVRIQTDDAVE